MLANRRVSQLAVAMACIASALTAPAAVLTVGEGTWPDSWPEEMEHLRDGSTSRGIGSGAQEDIYEIPFRSPEQFEELWPVILRLQSPRAPLRLTSLSPDSENEFLASSRPLVRIYAPVEGLIVDCDIALPHHSVKWHGYSPEQQMLFEEQGLILRIGPPWPEYLQSKDGELPEYVAVHRDTSEANGPAAERPEWRPVVRRSDVPGFHFRARTEIELVVDGEIIDLNRIQLPPDTPIIDNRTVPAHAADAAQTSHLEETK